MGEIAGIKIQKVAEPIQYVKALFYGAPGVGKTRLAGSASLVPALSPVLFVDVEGGVKSIRNLYPDVDYVRIADHVTEEGKVISSAWDKAVEIVESLRAKCEYRTVVLDSLSDLNKSVTKLVNYRSWTENPGTRDLDVPSKRDWGKAGERTRWIVKTLRDMPINVIFTALEGGKKDADGNVLKIGPQLPGQLADQVPAYFDEVFYLYTKTVADGAANRVAWMLLSRPDGSREAKDRSDRMPVTMENPTMAEIAPLVLDPVVEAATA